jgi:hypothetical protein
MSTHQARRLSQPQATQAMVSQPGAVMVVVGEWTGGLASALRRAKRENIYAFAAGLGIGASTVDSWDKHPEIVPRMKMQKALDRALQTAPCEVKQRFIELTRGGSLVGVPDSCGLDQIGGDANRSQLLKMFLGLLGAAVVSPEVGERLLGDRAGRVDAGLLDSHERLARSLAAEYQAGDPRVVVPAALAHADDVLGLWRRPTSDRRRLEALVVGVNARAGLWAFFEGDLRAAHKHLLAAWGLAAAGGEPGLLAQAMTASSVLYSGLHAGGGGGEPQEAVALLDQAGELAVYADPHTRLWVATWRADEVVAAGDLRASRASVDAASQARELLDDDPDVGGWTGILVYGLEGRLQTVRANLSALEGRFTDAEDELGVVLRAALESDRGQARALTRIGRVRVRASEPDGACEALSAGLDLAEPAGYAMGVERVRGVRARFPKPWAALSCVRALDERLAWPPPHR